MRTLTCLLAAAVVGAAIGCGGGSGGEETPPAPPAPRAALPSGIVPAAGSASAPGGHSIVGGALRPAQRQQSTAYRIENGGITP